MMDSHDESSQSQAHAQTQEARFLKACWIAQIITMFMYLFLGCCMLNSIPDVFSVVLAALTPWLVLVAVVKSRGLYCLWNLDGSSSSFFNLKTPNLGLAFLASSIALAACVPEAFHIREWFWLEVGGSVVAFIMISVAYCVLKDRRALTVVVTGAFLYGYGAVALCDWIGDHAPFTLYKVAITAKNASENFYNRYYISLAPWGPSQLASESAVPHGFYDTLHTGDTVCVYLHSGALGIPWYTIVSCKNLKTNKSPS